jgi:capsular exopolysaccharide synthesis family protein
MRFRSQPMQVILVTSCQPQDGKSFISFNLATSIAKVGHKTVVLDSDLRRPTLHLKFKTDNSVGLSNYMTDNTPKENIIRQTNVENLFFIPAGPVLPNTSELIEAGSLDKLIEWLRTKFDYIIIDTTPAGIVSDSSLMMKYASIVLLVIRNESTLKDDLNSTINLFQINKIDNYEIVVNDLNIKESRYGRYNNYYTNDQKKKFYGK